MTAETRWENGAAETQGRRVQPCIQSESLLEEEEEEEEECCKGKDMVSDPGPVTPRVSL